ncbi:hypothetical protein GCM10023192_56760 [Amycolatopsis samaneae]
MTRFAESFSALAAASLAATSTSRAPAAIPLPNAFTVPNPAPPRPPISAMWPTDFQSIPSRSPEMFWPTWTTRSAPAMIPAPIAALTTISFATDFVIWVHEVCASFSCRVSNSRFSSDPAAFSTAGISTEP